MASEFLDILQGYYEEQVRTGNIDTPPIKYSTLGVTLSKVVGQHQAFLLIQTVLGDHDCDDIVVANAIR